MPIAELPGVRLHYLLLEPNRSIAPRANLVLVHGLAANVAFWYWKIAPGLASADRVLLVDLRGHGLSSMPLSGYTAQAMADDLKAQLDLLNMATVHLLGHSFGGRVVIQFASKYPERVKSVVLADVLLKPLQPRRAPAPQGMWPAYRAVLAREGIRFDEETDEPNIALLEGLARLRLKYDGTTPAPDMPIAWPFAGSAGRRSARQWLRLLDETTARQDIAASGGLTPDRLAEVRAPVLLVYGEHSQAMPTGLALRKLWPHSRLEIVPRSGRFFPLARPDRLLAAVHGFLGAHPRFR